jgi:acyl-CoA synthetase (NDP forming)
VSADLSKLFDPRGVVVVGVSSHPGKFGFVALHNILAGGYGGKVFATNRDGVSVLGVQSKPDLTGVPDGAADLAFICTPGPAVPEVLEQAAERGIGAAFVASGGFGESGEAGRQAELALADQAERLGIVLAGPNGQGVVSTPARLCAQIVAPYPPSGRVSVVSQSGNLVSTFLNHSRRTGVGVARAVSAGNAVSVSVADYLRWFTADDQTDVSLAYLEGIPDGRSLLSDLADVTASKPLVVLKGGATEGGQQAAASHTGSLASDDRIVDGILRQAGAVRARTVDDAWATAAAFATQPLPRGPRLAVLTTAGGWGVLAADAVAASGLELVELPSDLLASIGEHVPPRWSRGNPIDLAGGETRNTIPEVLGLVAAHEGIDAVLLLGTGIQSNQARLMRDGPFYPDHGLERIVDYHERQDQRFAQATVDVSAATGKPVMMATELAVADPNNPAPATLTAAGGHCFSSADSAIRALDGLWTYSRFRQRVDGVGRSPGRSATS